MIRIIDPKSCPTKDLHQYLLGAVSPRPIAFASTVDLDGNPNLAPYSFFNCFSSNPPIVVFSSNRRVANNTTKDTLHNIEATKEVVINVVSHSIVRQMGITSIGFDTGVSEFEMAGLTPVASQIVKPFRVKESPVSMECKVKNIIPLGEEGGAGHLIICEVVLMHVDEAVLDADGKIDPHKIDLMGRMGRAFYVRASGENVQPLFQDVTKMSIGYPALPTSIKESHIFSANNLGQFAGLLSLPEKEDILTLKEAQNILPLLASANAKNALHQHAKDLLDNGDQRELAIKVAMLGDLI